MPISAKLRAATLAEQLFPVRIADQDRVAFQRYRQDSTTTQLRIALWCALLTTAAYGLWDAYYEDGGAQAMRFRFLVVCPLLLTFALSAYSSLASRYRDVFVLAFLVSSNAAIFVLLVIIGRGNVFGFATGTATANYFLVVFFACGLLPLLFRDGAIVAALVLLSHCLLLSLFSRLSFFIQSNYDFNVSVGCVVGVFVCYWRERYIRAQFSQLSALSAEKEGLASRLIGYVSLDALQRKHGEIIADAFGEVTILFTDIAGFTALSERLAPKHLLEVLSEIFLAFDEIIDRNQVEKVKTIGDSYMVIAGTKGTHPDHANKIAMCAIEMNDALSRISSKMGYPLQLRSGIHSGSIIGGVIGEKNPIYDYWGKTVNTASRLEHASLPGEIQISEATFWRVRQRFNCEARGEIELRDIGRTNCYFLKGAIHSSEVST